MMFSVRLDQMHRALRRITGGRHIRRPCFDFGAPTCLELSRLDLLNSRQLRDITCLVNKGFAKFPAISKINSQIRHIAINNENIEQSRIAMALNKLSIDKVELADKRVLVRYVFYQKTFVEKTFKIIFIH